MEGKTGKRTLNGAGALAVDALNLVGTDDQVLKSGAVLELEDGVAVTTLGLTSALDTTAVGLHATIEGARDDLGLLVGDGALGSRDGEAVSGESTEKGGGDEGERRHC
jgi:hypothetical protein